MPRSFILAFFLILCNALVNGGNTSGTRNNEILSIINIGESQWQSFVYDRQVFENRIDTFRKVQFWNLVMRTSNRMMIVNEALSRRILEIISYKQWARMSDEEKDDYRCALRQEFMLGDEVRIYATQGKEEFYQFRKVMPTIDRGIHVFMENDVDPWYAQAILLIESPGQLVKSPDGALGSFQLMKKVAKKFGLRVDRDVDERRDFDRSAYAASQLITAICLPYTREMLSQKGVVYMETDLWFRLMVLHVYHAGAYNVKTALMSIETGVQGMEIIKTLWETEAKGFKNASQNYSQVALASLLRLDELIHEQCVIYHSTYIPVRIRNVVSPETQVAEVPKSAEN